MIDRLLGRKFIVAFFLLFACALLIGNASTPLWDQDEAAYAGFARNMLVDHHWVVPHFPYTQAHRKPPLVFWAIAGSYAALGINEFALRLPSVLGVAISVAAVWYAGRSLVGRNAASLGAMVLASSLLVLSVSKIALLDGVLLAFQTVAALAMLDGVMRPSWKATVVLWVAVAGGLLAKGPPILILVGGMFVFLLVLHPRRWSLVHLHPWFGLPLAMVPLAIWIHLAWQQDQRYVLFLGYWYILRRVGGSTFGQGGPPGTYLVVLFVCLFPWTAYLLAGLKDLVGSLRRRRLRAVLLAGWLFGGWVIWELMKSKLPTYVLGAFPALALMIAGQILLNIRGTRTWASDAWLRAGYRAGVVVAAILAVGVLGAAFGLGATWHRWLAVAPAAGMIAVAVVAVRCQQRAEPVRAVKTLAMGSMVCNLLIWLVVIPHLDPVRSGPRQVASVLASQCAPNTAVFMFKRASLPSLPFYIENHGLQFHEPIEPQERATVQVDWSLLWQRKFNKLVAQVKSQNPQELPDDVEEKMRAERVTSLVNSGQPVALIFDPWQYAAWADRLNRARVIQLDGWMIYNLSRTTYVLAILPAAAKTR